MKKTAGSSGRAKPRRTSPKVNLWSEHNCRVLKLQQRERRPHLRKNRPNRMSQTHREVLTGSLKKQRKLLLKNHSTRRHQLSKPRQDFLPNGARRSLKCLRANYADGAGATFSSLARAWLRPLWAEDFCCRQKLWAAGASLWLIIRVRSAFSITL